MLQRLFRGLQWPADRKLILIEALVCTALAWVSVRLTPYDSWRRELGVPVPLAATTISGPPAQSSGAMILTDIAWAHRVISRIFGSRFTCLMLAFSVRSMLRRRGLSSLLVLGAKRRNRPSGDPLGAHAWVLCQGFEMVGGDTRDGHIAIAAYESAFPN